ncbi:MAG: D-alanyl-D-alanine carboxypeptidase [Deltaproteobacteria bacterium]|nr:D-alanyl-D-alanine carboxypeptidase [Deltaproteobacteria bacterium]
MASRFQMRRHPDPCGSFAGLILKAFTVLTLILPCSYSHGAPIKTSDGVSALHERLVEVTGPQDSVIIASSDNKNLIAVNADHMLIPASILKVLTSLAAIEILGEEFRFKTEFFRSAQGDLIIKGYGDPFLISEEIRSIAEKLRGFIENIQDIILDASYFSRPVIIPGRSNTPQPYDAPNGALCVNFNTVNFRREQGHWVSAEPQTPLLPFAIPRIESSGLKKGRITMASTENEGLRYAGELFKYFFTREGIKVNGGIRIGETPDGKDHLIFSHKSSLTVLQIAGELLEYSNNFIANQLLLAIGAKYYSAPSTLVNGISVLEEFCDNRLGIEDVRLAEGSGLSRDNRISARAMLTVLEHFSPYQRLLRSEGRQRYKTGTLWNVSTRAGYLDSRSGGVYRFVVMRNSKGKSAEEVTRIIERYLK